MFITSLLHFSQISEKEKLFLRKVIVHFYVKLITSINLFFEAIVKCMILIINYNYS